jgi:AraC-like DNA-binding protein
MMVLPDAATLHLVILCLLAGHQVFVAAFLAAGRDGEARRQAGMILFLALNAFADLTVAAQALGASPVWSAVRVICLFGFGPALLAYARAMTSAPPAQDRWLWPKRLAPALLAALCLTPFLALTRFTHDRALSGQDSQVQAATVGVMAALLIFSASGAVYLLMVLRMLRTHLAGLKALFSNIEDQTLSWLRWILLMLAAAWLIDLADTLCSALLGQALLNDLTADLIEAAWVYPLTFMALRQRWTLSRPEAKAETTVADKRRYARSALGPEGMQRIASKLERAMRDGRLHRNAGLTLVDLQAEIRTPSNHISQTLNVFLGQTFFDFVNGWRIRDACGLLETTDLSILEISDDVGFQSRSTFNAAFRKLQGVAPSAYRVRHRPSRRPESDPDGNDAR